MEKIVGFFFVGFFRLVLIDVKVNLIVRFYYFWNFGDGCGEVCE